MSSQQNPLVSCPTCRKYTEYSTENKFRPFCCERCKLIDLGLWADEGYKISRPLNENDVDEYLLNTNTPD